MYSITLTSYHLGITISLLVLLLNRPFPASFYFCIFNTVDSKQMFNINLAKDWIHTPDLWCRWQPLYQLSHNPLVLVFKNGPSPAFSNIQYNFTANIGEKCQSSIQYWESNPRPSEHESPPITTSPGLPPASPSSYPPL